MADKDQSEGAWIFVSHSNKDAKLVRRIRDFLEAKGHRPLLFYLKCLENNDARLPQLIRDEISARTWFVLCDSDSARDSKWVQEEHEIVKSLNPAKRVYEELDLRQELEPQFKKLEALSKRATVFLSYSQKDEDIGEKIKAALEKQDYRISSHMLDASALSSGVDLEGQVKTGIESALRNGFVLLLLSPNYLASRWCEAERLWAFDLMKSGRPHNLVPVVIREAERVFAKLPFDLRLIHCLDVTGQTSQEVSDKIMRALEELKRRRIV